MIRRSIALILALGPAACVAQSFRVRVDTSVAAAGQQATLRAWLERQDGTDWVPEPTTRIFQFYVNNLPALAIRGQGSSGKAEGPYAVPIGFAANHWPIRVETPNPFGVNVVGNGTLRVGRFPCRLTVNAASFSKESAGGFAATLSDTASLPIAGKVITFRLNGNVVGTSTTTFQGLAWLDYRAIADTSGAHILSASFAGDIEWSSTSANSAFTLTDEVGLQSAAIATGAVHGTAGAMAWSSTFGQAISARTSHDDLMSSGTLGLRSGFYRIDPLEYATVRGTVTLSNLDANVQGVPIELQVRFPGTSLPLEHANVQLSASGGFAYLSTTPHGTYDIAVKGTHWLRKTLRGVQIAETNLHWILVNGDVDGDNEVAIGDVALLSGVFGAELGDPQWDERADLNGDLAVDIGDLAILSDNFGLVGDD